MPEVANRDGRYSANVFLENGGNEQQIAALDGDSFEWQEFMIHLAEIII